MSVVTRFAPSPTGALHIGSARTALYNYLFAHRHKGKFLLRIEDTDQVRSTVEATKVILEGLAWLGIRHDDDIIYQSKLAVRHKEVAEQLVAKGEAYYCYTAPEELEKFRENARINKQSMRFVSPWRDGSESLPKNGKPVVRLKMPLSGSIVVNDLVQGQVKVDCEQLDDLVLLRADGTPTYMLAVVVDDHDMSVTHVIRGDDHFTNSFRQAAIYKAMSWDIPKFAHIPLIHGTDGAKLSKRHGATSIEEYKSIGILPEAMCNYLLRLGWSHGNDEIITQEQSISWFDLEHIGKSPARFDMKKLMYLNTHYIKTAEDNVLFEKLTPFIAGSLDRDISEDEKSKIIKSIALLKSKYHNLVDLTEMILPYVIQPKDIASDIDRDIISDLYNLLVNLDIWNHNNIKDIIKSYIDDKGLEMHDIMDPLRLLVTGHKSYPNILNMLEVIGKEETLRRLDRK